VGRIWNFFTNRRIASASLVRIGSTTRTVNTVQRRVSLNLWCVPVLGRYYATIPNDPGIVIPGFWMLFVMDEAGTPSIAKMILITSNMKTIGSSDEKQCEHGFLCEYRPSWKPALTAQIPRRG
jgi:galactose oxidase